MLAALVCAIWTGIGLAEPVSNPLPTATAAPAAAKKPSGPLTPIEIYSLATDMNRINYGKFKYRRYLSELVGSLERLIDYQCASSFKLGAPAPKISGDCAKSVDELLDLDSENPVALCARDGLSSKSCVSAFEKQEVGSLNPSSYSFLDELTTPELSRQASDSFNLEFQLAEAKDNGERSEKDAEARRLEGQIISADSPALREQLRNLYAEILHGSCKFSRLRLALEEEMVGLREAIFYSAKNAQAKPTPVPGSVEDLVQKFSEPNGSPTPAGGSKGYFRIRLLGPLCSNVVQRAVMNTPDLAAAICYRDGWDSPSCATALDRESKRPKTNDSTAPDQPGTGPKAPAVREGGMATF